MTDPATLDHLCHSRLQAGPPHTDSARLIFRALQAAAQCCLELQQRYAAGTAQAVQLSQGQLELMPTLQVGCCGRVCYKDKGRCYHVYPGIYRTHQDGGRWVREGHSRHCARLRVLCMQRRICMVCYEQACDLTQCCNEDIL